MTVRRTSKKPCAGIFTLSPAVFLLTNNSLFLASRHPMVGIFSERQPFGRRFFRRLLMAGLLLSPCIGFGQSAAATGTQSNASTYSFKILKQHKISFGQHSVTFNRVVPPIFPTPVATPTPAPVIPPWMQGVEYDQLLFFSATIYDNQLTVLQYFDGNRGMVAVSNINFNYLAIDGFVEADTFYEIIMARDDESSADADPVTAAWLAQARGALTAGAPGYVVVSGTASADTIQALDAIHTYYGASGSILVQEYRQWQQQNAARLLQLKLHPPVRPNTVINYWPIKSSVYPTSSNP